MCTSKKYVFFLVIFVAILTLQVHPMDTHAKSEWSQGLKKLKKNFQNQVKNINKQIKSLQADVLRKNKELRNLSKQVKVLQVQNGQFMQKHQTLNRHHKELKVAHQTLSRNYMKLQHRYQSHRKKYNIFKKFVASQLNQTLVRKRKLICKRFVNRIQSPVSGQSYGVTCGKGFKPVGGGIDAHSKHAKVEINTWTPRGRTCKIHGSSETLTCIAVCCRIE